METSFFQQIKIEIVSILHFSKDAIHFHLGLFLFFLWITIFRRSISSYKSIIPVIVTAVILELFDLRDDFNSFGYYRWGASLHDLINTTFWPFVIVSLFKSDFFRK